MSPAPHVCWQLLQQHCVALSVCFVVVKVRRGPQGVLARLLLWFRDRGHVCWDVKPLAPKPASRVCSSVAYDMMTRALGKPPVGVGDGRFGKEWPPTLCGVVECEMLPTCVLGWCCRTVRPSLALGSCTTLAAFAVRHCCLFCGARLPTCVAGFGAGVRPSVVWYVTPLQALLSSGTQVVPGGAVLGGLYHGRP